MLLLLDLKVWGFEAMLSSAWSTQVKPLQRPNSWTKSRHKYLKFSSFSIHSHLHSFAFRCLSLQTHATCYSFYSLATVHCKGERRKPDRKPDRKPYPLPNTETPSLRTLKIMPRNLNKIVCSWIRLLQWWKNLFFAVQMISSNLTYVYLLNFFFYQSMTEIGLLYLHCAHKCMQYRIHTNVWW